MKVLRVALAQINTTVGDIEGNTKKIISYIDKAKKEGADIVAFPELAITGYPPEDLLLKPSFVERNLKALSEIAKISKGIISLVGFVDRDNDLYNALAVVKDGEILAVYHKNYLPNYGVFDELRYFKRGDKGVILDIDGCKVGLSICEDLWYPHSPITKQVLKGAEVLISVNASPFHKGKLKERVELLKVRARDHHIFIGYVNMVGGQDELVFDSSSMFVSPSGRLVSHITDRIEGRKDGGEGLLVQDIPVEDTFRKGLKDNRIRSLRETFKDTGDIQVIQIPYKLKERDYIYREVGDIDYPSVESDIYYALCVGLRDYIQKNGFSKVVVGLSGGIDSSVVGAVAVDTLGRENVKGILMPSRYTSKESTQDALKLGENLGIETITVPIDNLFQLYLDTLNPIFKGLKPDITEENLQARIRGNILMALSNKFGWLVLTTGNKSEMSVGYATLYGDMAGGFAVLKDVYKTEVYKLAEFINKHIWKREVIPQRVIKKPPSAELRPDQKDEDELLPYPILDRIIQMYVEEDIPVNQIGYRLKVEEGLDVSQKDINRIVRMIDINEYKRRQAPIGIKVSKRNYGKDRRMPITNRYRE
ncbi:MAG: NAD+ synthase [Aquificae bacterium]|nr:NAD+ synthase [Aquificota bacterium]